MRLENPTRKTNGVIKEGNRTYYKFHHTPAPLVKSTIANYFESHSEAFETNIKYRFRNENQFTIQGLVSHLHILKNKAILKKGLQLIYFGSYRKPLIWYIFVMNYATWNKSKLFLCLQS